MSATPIPPMPGWTYGPRPDNMQAFQFFISNQEYFDNSFREVEQREIFWREVMPEGGIVTGINPGADSWSYPVLDWRGQGAWRGIYGKNIPTVAMATRKVNMPIMLGAVSALMDTEEVRRVQMGVSMNLETQYPIIMRKAYDRHVEGAFFYGDLTVGFLPFLDYPGVPVIASPDEWANMTVEQILAELNSYIAYVWTTTGMRHFPNTIMLPASHLAYLAGLPRGTGTDTTVLTYFLENNIYTRTTNQQFKVMALPYLDTAGTGGSARMIIAEINANTMQMAFPLPYTQLAPQLEDFSIKLFAEYKFGPVHLPLPNTFLYVDGI